MERVLRFKSHLRVECSDSGVFLVGEGCHHMLTGPRYTRLAPLVDGQRTVGQLVEALADELPAHEVYFAVEQLVANGYLVHVPEMAPEAAAFWDALNVDPGEAGAALKTRTVGVQIVGDLEPAPLKAALERAGLRVVRPGKKATLWVVLVEDYLDGRLARLANRARERGTAWALVKPWGVSPWVGPVFTPGQGACWECLAHRLRANRPVEAYLRQRMGDREPPPLPRAALPAGEQAALGLAAVLLARWLVSPGSEEVGLDGSLVALDLATAGLQRHAVVRRPQCPACGEPDLLMRRSKEPLELSPRPKVFTEDGGHRCASPTETVQRLEHQISPLTGAVTHLGPVPGRDHPLRPVYSAAWSVCPLDRDTPRPEHFHRASMGKGRTAAQARASALCEAVERWSASFQGDEPVLHASFADLGDDAVPPAALLCFSEAQYRRRNELNALASGRAEYVPRPLYEDQGLDWTPAWSLTHQRHRYVPAACCFTDMPLPPAERVARYDSNGDAAGNCMEEALLQGFLELVERDAAALWWYSRARRPGIDLDSFADPFFGALLDHYRGLGWRVHVLDITSDLAIPTFVAYGEAGSGGRFSVGFGCHLDARLAVQRALTELSQLFDPAGKHPLPWEPDSIGDPAFLHPDDTAPASTAADFGLLHHDDLMDDVVWCVERARRQGLETLVVDRTRPDVGLCVVKVMVPGLRHFWPRLGPGRLYEVPPRLGWIPRRLTEDQLNPVPLLV